MKRAISLAVLLSLSAFSSQVGAVPSGKKVITDPVGDANGINDQGAHDGTVGDFVTPADASSVTDLLEVKLANDAKNLYITFVTEAGPPATQGVGYALTVINPTSPNGTARCLSFHARYPGAGNDLSEPYAFMADTCNAKFADAKVVGQTIVVPRKHHKALGKGQVVKAPQALGYVHVGSSSPANVSAPILDTTKVGKNYKLVDKKKRR